MPPKNESFQGIHLLEFPAQSSRENNGKTIHAPLSGLYSVRYLCVIYMFLFSIIFPACFCLFCHSTPGVLVSHDNHLEEVYPPKCSSDLTTNSVISELSLINVVREVATEGEINRTFNKYLSRASSSNSKRIHLRGTYPLVLCQMRSLWIREAFHTN